MGDLLKDFDRLLTAQALSGRVTWIEVPGGPSEETQLRFLVYLGLYDLLADRVQSDGELTELLRRTEAAEGRIRFELYQQRSATEARERVARITSKEIAVTERWMVPKLEAEIEQYRARVRGLGEWLEATP
jgi:hypothetical protein